MERGERKGEKGKGGKGKVKGGKRVLLLRVGGMEKKRRGKGERRRKGREGGKGKRKGSEGKGT